VNGFRFKFAQALNEKTAILPESFYGDDFQVSLLSPKNGTYTVRVPYVRASRIEWQGHGARKYDGFELLREFGIFDLYRHSGGKDVLLLSWRRFGGSLVADMDALMVYAEAEDLLDHDLVWDWTRSRGAAADSARTLFNDSRRRSSKRLSEICGSATRRCRSSSESASRSRPGISQTVPPRPSTTAPG
jgi:hypothetical protein